MTSAMDRSLLLIFSFLLIAVASALTTVKHENLAAQIYWQTKLPNARMPNSIRELLVPDATSKRKSAGTADGHLAGTASEVRTSMLAAPSKSRPVFIYLYAATDTQLHDDPHVAYFFLHHHLRPGTQMHLRFHDPTPAAAFLPRDVADSLPFSTSHYADVLSKLSIDRQSSTAADVKKTLETCESPAAAGEARLCATSLESMVDFAVARLGEGARAVATEAAEDEAARAYTVAPSGAAEVKGERSVTCHRQAYPYAVYYCHETVRTRLYVVGLLRDDGEAAKAVVVCHEDTSGWNPKHLAFQVLKVKPGSVPICHFLPQHHLLWV